MTLLVQNLRRNIVRRSAQRLLPFAIELDSRRQPKITNLHIQLIVKEQIAQLQVPMDNPILVQILDAVQDLIDVETTLVVGDDAPTLVQLHHGALLAQLEDNVNVLRIVEEAEEFDDVLVRQRLMDENLLAHFLLLVVLHHQLLGDDLAGVHLVRLDVDDFVAFCEAALRNEKQAEKKKTKFVIKL